MDWMRKIKELAGRASRRAVAAATALALIAGPPLSCIAPQKAWAASLTGSVNWSDAMGVDKNRFVSHLENNANDYLGVPYSQMPCNMFVIRAIRDAGYSCPEMTVSGWSSWARKNKVRRYETKNRSEVVELGRSGLISKGDIILVNVGEDNEHMGLYWGDAQSGYDRMWNSLTTTGGVNYYKNAITPITGKGASRTYQVLSVQNEVNVNFTKVSAEPAITDGNAEYSLAGAEYDIFDSTDGSKAAHIVLDEHGRASYKLKPNRKYYAVETKAPKGFKLNPNRIEFTTGNNTAEERLVDDPGFVTFNVVKKDSSTLGAAQPGATLEGAEFKIVDSNGNTHTAVTDKDGRARFSRIPLGKITVTETKAPKGYKLDPEPKTYEVKAGQITQGEDFVLEPEDDFKENVVAFDIDLVKYKDTGAEGSGLQEPAEGVQFQIISNTTNEVVCTLTTDAYGKAATGENDWFGEGERPEGVTGAIPYDEAGYTVREVASTTPEGYLPAGDWKITPEQMADGATLHYIVDNDFVSTHLQIVKTDAESGAAVPLAGFTFQVLDEEKNPVTQEMWYPNHVEMSEFTTDGSGRVTLPQSLMPGTYYIREVAAQAPYLLNGEDVKIVIENTPALAPVVVATLTDRQATGTASIKKTCTEDGGALAGAEYDVVAMMDVKSPDGLMKAVEGEIVGHVVTGADGTAKVEGLALGAGEATYAFVETKAPSGHVLDATPHEFTLTYKDSATEVVTAHVDATDAPTHVIVDKDVKGTDDALAGAVFALWDRADEAPATSREADVLAVRAPEGKKVTCEALAERIVITAEGEGTWTLADEDGTEIAQADENVWAVGRGVYTLSVDNGGKVAKATVKARTDKMYAAAVDDGLLGTGEIKVDETDAAAKVDMEWSDEDGAYVAEFVSGRTRVSVDGRAVGVVDVSGDTYLSYGDGELTELPTLLKDGAEPIEHITDENGLIDIRHLTSGTYAVREVSAPEGYLVDGQVRAFTIAEDGTIDGQDKHTIAVEDDYTKVDLTKRSITDESEIEGAELSVLDKDGKVIDTWVSTTEPHRIERLAPGDYTLVEVMTPKTYDEATAVEFTVEATGEVQQVVMHDEPIEISAQVDKRQQIADPTADSHVANGDDANRADVTVSEDGSYAYTLDFRSTSGTWTDEFTVEDPLEPVAAGLAELKSITTPVAKGDYDGLMNIWYRTSEAPAEENEDTGGKDEASPAPGAEETKPEAEPEVKPDETPSANATLGDGHENPWLGHESNAEALGDDGRAIGYDGWKLWAEGVGTTVASELAVADLGLAEGERVSAVRFEYGRVDEGFTTRTGEWDREDLKHEHDDVTGVGSHEGDTFTETGKASITLEDGSAIEMTLEELEAARDGAGYLIDPDGDGNPQFVAEKDVAMPAEAERTLAPAIMHMEVSDGYVDGTTLENSARVDAYRNGGGEDVLEGHDTDRVVQAPKKVTKPKTPMAQTGGISVGLLFAASASFLLAAGLALWDRSRLTQ